MISVRVLVRSGVPGASPLVTTATVGQLVMLGTVPRSVRTFAVRDSRRVNCQVYCRIVALPLLNLHVIFVGGASVALAHRTLFTLPTSSKSWTSHGSFPTWNIDHWVVLPDGVPSKSAILAAAGVVYAAVFVTPVPSQTHQARRMFSTLVAGADFGDADWAGAPVAEQPATTMIVPRVAPVTAAPRRQFILPHFDFQRSKGSLVDREPPGQVRSDEGRGMGSAHGTPELAVPPPHQSHLRTLRADDLDAVFVMESDQASILLAAFTADDPADRAAFDAHYERIMDDPRIRNYAIEDGAGQLVGTIATYPSTDGPDEVTYWIDRSHWGRGHASRALAHVLAQLARPVLARVVADNRASRRVLEKAGFRVVGTNWDYAPGRGADVEELLLRLD